MNDLIPIFKWANEHGDANINDRIIIKVIPQLLKKNISLTHEIIESSETINVSQEIYDLVLKVSQELVGSSYKV